MSLEVEALLASNLEGQPLDQLISTIGENISFTAADNQFRGATVHGRKKISTGIRGVPRNLGL